MHSRPRILASVFAAFFLAAVLSQAASCTLDTGGTAEPGDLPKACNVDATCDDEDQCTVNLCGANKTCEFEPVDGLAAEQKAGDCQQGFCTKGVFTQNPDDMDLPDDLESCTTDTCANGAAVHKELADGASCTSGVAAGLCKAGKCTVECGPEKPCNDGNPCTEDTCNAGTGVCSFAVLDGLPTPDWLPIVGDCSQHICVNGTNEKIADDADLPNDSNSCTKDGCDKGSPVQTPVNGGAPCTLVGGTGVCNNSGQCVGCNAPEDCPAIDKANPCKQRTCTVGVCGVMDLDKVDVPSTSGDCKKTICNIGAPAEQIDNNDVPIDGNLCTKDLCTTGTPGNPPEVMGFNCGGTLTCNGAGQCTGCSTEADCGTDDDCKDYSCSMSNCNIKYTAPNMPVSTGQTIGDCKVKVCNGAGNVTTSIDMADIPNDMLECTDDSCSADGTPSNMLLALNTACTQNGGTVCDGLGACLKIGGADCLMGEQCLTGFCTDGVCCAGTCTSECTACNVMGSAGMCANVPANSDDAPVCTGTNSCDGMGACKRDNGQPCGMNAECSSGFCADGVCCTTACGDTCKSCNLTGTVGTCTLVPAPNADPTGTAPCTNPSQCDGQGVCKAVNGVICAKKDDCISNYCVDGYCCNNVCDQLCKACSNALTGGSSGSCLPILNGTDPASECPNGNCNGAGTCSGGGGNQANGTACTVAGQCSSGFCIDGVCCGTACTETCKTCNRSGFVGSCQDVPNALPDNTATVLCTGGDLCDGLGVCKGLNGRPCMTTNQCQSNYCVDGFCCGNVCNLTCQSCSAALNVAGVDGSCGPTKAGAESNNECPNGTCNGAGVCAP